MVFALMITVSIVLGLFLGGLMAKVLETHPT